MATNIWASNASLSNCLISGRTCLNNSDAVPDHLPSVWRSINVMSKSTARKLMPAAFKESIMLYEKYFSCFGGGLGVSPAAAMRAASLFRASTMWRVPSTHV